MRPSYAVPAACCFLQARCFRAVNDFGLNPEVRGPDEAVSAPPLSLIVPLLLLAPSA